MESIDMDDYDLSYFAVQELMKIRSNHAQLSNPTSLASSHAAGLNRKILGGSLQRPLVKSANAKKTETDSPIIAHKREWIPGYFGEKAHSSKRYSPPRSRRQDSYQDNEVWTKDVEFQREQRSAANSGRFMNTNLKSDRRDKTVTAERKSLHKPASRRVSNITSSIDASYNRNSKQLGSDDWPESNFRSHSANRNVNREPANQWQPTSSSSGREASRSRSISPSRRRPPAAYIDGDRNSDFRPKSRSQEQSNKTVGRDYGRKEAWIRQSNVRSQEYEGMRSRLGVHGISAQQSSSSNRFAVPSDGYDVDQAKVWKSFYLSTSENEQLRQRNISKQRGAPKSNSPSRSHSMNRQQSEERLGRLDRNLDRDRNDSRSRSRSRSQGRSSGHHFHTLPESRMPMTFYEAVGYKGSGIRDCAIDQNYFLRDTADKMTYDIEQDLREFEQQRINLLGRQKASKGGRSKSDRFQQPSTSAAAASSSGAAGTQHRRDKHYLDAYGHPMMSQIILVDDDPAVSSIGLSVDNVMMDSASLQENNHNNYYNATAPDNNINNLSNSNSRCSDAEWGRLCQWLNEKDISQYADNFAKGGITKLSVVELLHAQDLQLLGISNQDVDKILGFINEFSSRTRSFSQQALDELELSENANRCNVVSRSNNSPSIYYTSDSVGSNLETLKFSDILQHLLISFDSGDALDFDRYWSLCLRLFNREIGLNEKISRKKLSAQANALHVLYFNIQLYFTIFPIVHNQSNEMISLAMKRFRNELDYILSHANPVDKKEQSPEKKSPIKPFSLKNPSSVKALTLTKEFAQYSGIVFSPEPQSNPLYSKLFTTEWAESLRSKLELFMNLLNVPEEQPVTTLAAIADTTDSPAQVVDVDAAIQAQAQPQQQQLPISTPPPKADLLSRRMSSPNVKLTMHDILNKSGTATSPLVARKASCYSVQSSMAAIHTPDEASKVIDDQPEKIADLATIPEANEAAEPRQSTDAISGSNHVIAQLDDSIASNEDNASSIVEDTAASNIADFIGGLVEPIPASNPVDEAEGGAFTVANAAPEVTDSIVAIAVDSQTVLDTTIESAVESAVEITVDCAIGSAVDGADEAAPSPDAVESSPKQITENDDHVVESNSEACNEIANTAYIPEAVAAEESSPPKLEAKIGIEEREAHDSVSEQRDKEDRNGAEYAAASAASASGAFTQSDQSEVVLGCDDSTASTSVPANSLPNENVELTTEDESVNNKEAVEAVDGDTPRTEMLHVGKSAELFDVDQSNNLTNALELEAMHPAASIIQDASATIPSPPSADAEVHTNAVAQNDVDVDVDGQSVADKSVASVDSAAEKTITSEATGEAASTDVSTTSATTNKAVVAPTKSAAASLKSKAAAKALATKAKQSTTKTATAIVTATTETTENSADAAVSTTAEAKTVTKVSSSTAKTTKATSSPLAKKAAEKKSSSSATPSSKAGASAAKAEVKVADSEGKVDANIGDGESADATPAIASPVAAPKPVSEAAATPSPVKKATASSSLLAKKAAEKKKAAAGSTPAATKSVGEASAVATLSGDATPVSSRTLAMNELNLRKSPLLRGTSSTPSSESKPAALARVNTPPKSQLQQQVDDYNKKLKRNSLNPETLLSSAESPQGEAIAGDIDTLAAHRKEEGVNPLAGTASIMATEAVPSSALTQAPVSVIIDDTVSNVAPDSANASEAVASPNNSKDTSCDSTAPGAVPATAIAPGSVLVL